MPNNWHWKYWLEEFPQAAYEAFRPRTGPETFLDYWRGQGGRVRDDYMGALGQQALRGEPPSLSFVDFLGNYPFMQRWLGMSPERRGFSPGRYAPRMRWNMFGRSR
ncbi:MAG: hypothetical protein DDT36_01769 [Firmicutes bacterium]|nr:hypothetical protein [Bacillota bacterium]